MDINKTLMEYGKLKIELKEINKKISELFEKENLNNIRKGELYNQTQVSRFFDYRKEEREHQRYDDEEPYEFEDWCCDIAEEEVRPNSLKILELIQKRKDIRYDLGYKKRSITRYATKLYREEK